MYLKLWFALLAFACFAASSASAQYLQGRNILITPGTGTASPIIAVVPAPDFPGWSTIHTSAFGGCPSTPSPISSAINLAISAGAALPATQNVEIVVDCGGSITAPLVLPSAAINMLVDQQFNTLTVPAGYGQDVWQQLVGSQSHVGIVNVDLNFLASPSPETTGAAFDMQSCSGCYIQHVHVEGMPYDLFDLGSNVQLLSPPINGGVWSNSTIDDVQILNGGTFHGVAFRLNGIAQNDMFADYTLVSAGDGTGVSANSAGMSQFGSTTYPDWQQLFFLRGDFEQTAGGFSVNMPKGRMYGLGLTSQIVNTTILAPALSIVADGTSGLGTVSHVSLLDDSMSSGGSNQAAIMLSATASGGIADVQMIGGDAYSALSDAISIGAGVVGTQLNGVQERASLGCGVHDSGTDTLVTAGLAAGGLGAILPTAPPSYPPYGGNAIGICAEAGAAGGQYVSLDLRNNSQHAVLIAPGAGPSTNPIYIARVNVAGYASGAALSYPTPAGTSTPPAYFNAAFNPGFASSAQNVACSLSSFVTANGPLACIDAGGNFGVVHGVAALRYALLNGTEMFVSSAAQCGVADTALLMTNPSPGPTGAPYYLSADTSGNVGICGSLIVQGSMATINGTKIAPKKGTSLTCTLTGTSCSVSATVANPSTCTASHAPGTTVAQTNLLPIAINQPSPGPTVLITGYANVAVGTLSFDYFCL